MKRFSQIPSFAVFSVLAIFGVILIGGCVRSREPVLGEQAPFPPSSGGANPYARNEAIFPTVASEATLKIREGDTVQVKIWGETMLSNLYTVGPDGMITLPLIGDVLARGKTRAELTKDLMEKSKKYYKSPILDVSTAKFGPRYTYVFGGVRYPGAIPLLINDTVLSCITKAGGIHEREDGRGHIVSSPNKVRVIRNRTDVALLDLAKMHEGQDLRSNIAIYPDDLIYVVSGGAGSIIVLGEVKAPKVVGLTPGMDVIKAIGEAEGITDDAADTDIRVVRKWWTKSPEIISVNFVKLRRGTPTGAVLLEDQDIIYVPKKAMAWYNYYLNQITPTMSAISMAEDIYIKGRNLNSSGVSQNIGDVTTPTPAPTVTPVP
ncbi:MAG: polysaccharide biosynthesis/export family protein [Candidatus Sumerlaeota bacterium]|nr:polysaccharide biosynthesis/export family protein [Candidatus Sumerlaeota bacterium]